MVEVENLESEIAEQSDTQIGMDVFRNILQSLREVQKGAFRTIGGKVINSIPLDMDIELSDCISKMTKMEKQRDEASRKIIESYGCILTPIDGGVQIAPPEDKKDDIEFLPNIVKEISMPIEFDVKAALPSFTKERFKQSGIDLSDAPNRQVFFQNILS